MLCEGQVVTKSVTLFCILTMVSCASRNALITGRVLSDDHSEPVSDAVIQLAADGRLLPAKADRLGWFKVGVPEANGCYRLEVRRIGFGRGLVNVPLRPGDSVDVGVIRLQPAITIEEGAAFWKFCRMTPDTVSDLYWVEVIKDTTTLLLPAR